MPIPVSIGAVRDTSSVYIMIVHVFVEYGRIYLAKSVDHERIRSETQRSMTGTALKEKPESIHLSGTPVYVANKFRPFSYAVFRCRSQFLSRSSFSREVLSSTTNSACLTRLNSLSPSITFFMLSRIPICSSRSMGLPTEQRISPLSRVFIVFSPYAKPYDQTRSNQPTSLAGASDQNTG